MTALAAHVRHRTPGRTRIEIPGLKGQAGSLSKIANEMTHLFEGVREVKMDPLLGTLTVYHHKDAGAQLPEISRQHQWFELTHAKPVSEAAEEITHVLHRGFCRLDHDLQKATGNRFNVRSLLFFSMMGLGVLQVRRGKTLPAGMTLLMQAQAFLANEDKSEAVMLGDADPGE